MSPLEPGPIYAPGAGPPHPALWRRQAERARREEAASAAAAAWSAPLQASPEPVALSASPAALGYPVPPASPMPVPAPAPVPVSAPVPVRPAPARIADERRRFDWVIGIVLGIVLGLGVATAFVFIGSEDTVDAPQVRGDVPARADGPDPNGRAEPERVSGE